jgi:hypothetical protein
LDSDYGAVLQEWLLRHFTIRLVVESLAEPWFSDARVGTVVLAATRCDDERERSSNVVRFVTLRRSLRELYGEALSERDHLDRVDTLRDTLLAVPDVFGETADYDWSAISQAELMQLGLRVDHGPVP